MAKQNAGFATIAAYRKIIKHKHETAPANLGKAMIGSKKRGITASLFIFDMFAR
jgi:hypothetical protein